MYYVLKVTSETLMRKLWVIIGTNFKTLLVVK